jgi:hypothetical protein
MTSSLRKVKQIALLINTLQENMLTWLAEMGVSREGNDKYVELYDRVKQDRLIDNGVFKESTWRTGLRREQRWGSAGEMTPFQWSTREDRDDVGVLTALMHDNEQSVTAADAPTQAVDGTAIWVCRENVKNGNRISKSMQLNSFGWFQNSMILNRGSISRLD